MILRVETEIISNTILKEKIETKVYPYLIELYPNENLILHKISMQKPIFDYEKFLPVITIENKKITNVALPTDEFIIEFQEMFQLIESFGGLDLEIEKINWENPFIKWIAETEEERIPINAYRRDFSFDKQRYGMSLKWLDGLITSRRMLSHLVLPFSFYREGMVHYKKQEYINSFLNFFLMLEGAFANGKFRKNDVITEFKKSEVLVNSINKAIQTIERQANQIHKKWLDKYYDRQTNLNSDEIIKILVKERGALSHYSMQNKRRQRNSFENKNYQTIAFIAMMICKYSSIKLRLEPYKK